MLSYFALNKKNGEIANFSSKPWTNHFAKMHFFRLFVLPVFHCLERCFFFLKYTKTHIYTLFFLQKKDGKLPFSDFNHGLFSLQKSQFFYFFPLLFF